MKAYFVEFQHKKSHKIFQKFGVTSKSDVLERFNTKYDDRWNDFNIRVLWSAYGDNQVVESFEKEMLNRYPKNMYLETFLGEDYGYFDGLGGITEVVSLTLSQRNSILNELFKRKDERQRLI